jgi:hypothetical protein
MRQEEASVEIRLMSKVNIVARALRLLLRSRLASLVRGIRKRWIEPLFALPQIQPRINRDTPSSPHYIQLISANYGA